jgi:aspartyl-tRNA(Asn)/glutamyl-tRNA(Gln) amidotransferase subunit A
MKRRDYAVLTASDMARLVRHGEVSPVALTQAALEAIAATEPAINAWGEVLADASLAHARQLEQEALRGHWRGPLHGVPVGIKDLFLTAGIATRKGSRLLADWVPAETAPAVQRLLDAGAVMVGKNTTTENGWKASSTSPLYGVTRNPWNPARTTGGSSSGSAAAVAAGNVPISLGSDGGGSLRIPAAFCGVFSLKATLGRVPTWPLSTSEHLSHAGPITQTVLDCALALDVLKGPDPRDPASLPAEAVSYVERLGRNLPPLRCALAPSLFGHAVDPAIAQVVAQAFAQVRRIQGVTEVEAPDDWADPLPIFEGLWTARGATTSPPGAPARDAMDPGWLRLVDAAAGMSAGEHLRRLQERAVFCRRVVESFQAFDLLILPMLPVPAFAAEAEGPAEMDRAPLVPWARWTPFSYPFNLTGQPAASIPCGWTPDGMPVGLQVVGRRFDDANVLHFCAVLEQAFQARLRRPAVFAGH